MGDGTLDVVWSLAGFGGGVVLLFIVILILALPMRIFGKLLINALIGFALLLLFNFLGGALFSFRLALTPFNALLVGTLGVPGLVILVILTLIL